MRRSVLALCGAATAAAIGAAAVEPASALTRSEARQAALAASTARQGNGDLIVFGLRRALGPRQSVSLATPRNLGVGLPSAAQRSKLRPLGRRTWLFWEDLAPGAAFIHPSRVILVDDRTGRVRVRPTGLYPLVDGRRPAFLRSWSAYHNRRWHILRRVRTPAAFPASQNQSPTPPPRVVPRGFFNGHCVYMIGAFGDPLFKSDFDVFRRESRRVGMKAVYATKSGAPPSSIPPRPGQRSEGTVSEISEDLKFMRDKLRCKDILFYVAGHGYPAKGSAPQLQKWLDRVHTRLTPRGKRNVVSGLRGALKLATAQPTVQIGDNDGKGDPVFLTKRAIELAIADASGPAGTPKHLTYKFKFQSCFSGRFVGAFKKDPNVLMVEASSGEFEPSFGAFGPLARRVTGARNPGISEFTWANIVGWQSALGNGETIRRIAVDGESAVVALSAVGWATGLGVDRVEWLGFTTPRLELSGQRPLVGRGPTPGSNPPGQTPPSSGGGGLVPITPPPVVIPPG